MTRSRHPTASRGSTDSCRRGALLKSIGVVTILAATLGASSFSVAGTAKEPAGRLTCTDPRAFHDGDTFTCVHEAGSVRVRVAGIDAPETGQDFWRVSRDLLRKRAIPGTVVDCYKVDVYERQVCRLVSPAGEDISLELVQTGLAWHSRKYAFEQRPEERGRYEAAEALARQRGLGLWSLPDPQEPSECRVLRKERKKCR